MSGGPPHAGRVLVPKRQMHYRAIHRGQPPVPRYEMIHRVQLALPGWEERTTGPEQIHAQRMAQSMLALRPRIHDEERGKTSERSIAFDAHYPNAVRLTLGRRTPLPYKSPQQCLSAQPQ
jgi:hypothetical protein